MRFEGRCHCGNIEVSFETSTPPAELQLRECGCTFCRRHGATAVTDPAGSLEVRLRDDEVSRYRFGLRTAEFLVCRTCGVFVAAVCAVGDRTVATLNANTLDARASLTATPVRVEYGAETGEGRVARRARVWTPAVVRDRSAPRAPELEALVRRWIEEGWQRGRAEMVAELHAPGFVDHDAAGRASDGAGFQAGIRALYAAFPDFHAAVKDVVVDERRGEAAVRWAATGTHAAPFLGVAATGRRIAFKGIEIVRIGGGRIAERWGEWDGLDLLAQLGAGREA